MVLNLQRHLIRVSDRDVALYDRMAKVYACMLAVQPVAPSRTEKSDMAHLSAVMQHHHACVCPVPQDES